MKYILCDHWKPAPDGWIILKEEDQDITKRFQWEDNSVDALFSCHGVEHVNMIGGINYMRESYRVLKPGGILRTVCPFIDRMVEFVGGTSVSKNYIETSLSPYFPAEALALMEMNIRMTDHGLPFFFDSMLKGHNHRFLWTTDLMVEVLKKVGFKEIFVQNPGDTSFSSDDCLERVVRGVSDPNVKFYDCESLVVEARK